eukprot:6490255-Amphidinium_carterae.6
MDSTTSIVNPQRPVDDDDTRSTTLQQLLSISYHYAPQIFDAMKEQKLTGLRKFGMADDQIQAHREILRSEKILELYMLPEKTLDMWQLQGCLPAAFISNGTDPKHVWYNFHTEIEYAINDFINVY